MSDVLQLSAEQESQLRKVAEQLVVPGKGIFSFQENKVIIGHRLEAMGAKDTEAFRTKYRKLFLTASGSLGNYLSGLLLSDDCLDQREVLPTATAQHLAKMGVLAGVQFDRGYSLLMGTDQECTTQGLDGFERRCAEYQAKGVKFLKWRAVIEAADKCRPSALALAENANALARFASECQKNTMLPVLHVDLLADDSQNLELRQWALERALAALAKALSDHAVLLEGCLLMVGLLTRNSEGVPGGQQQTDAAAMAMATLTALRRTVPAAVPGVVLMSGALGEEEASAVLDALNKQEPGRRPWALTFGFGRAMQVKALKTWAGQNKFYNQAQTEFLNRLKINCKASLGKYIEIPEVQDTGKSSEHKGKKKK